MIINSIKIENFQSYYKNQTIEFSRGLNLIIGNGGKGKSKLFNAFYWVLFGKIYITGEGWCSTDTLPQSANYRMKRYDFINKKALVETSINENVTASVCVIIEDDKGLEYQIERSVEATAVKNELWQDGSSWEVKASNLKVMCDTITGTRMFTNVLAEDKINQLFPEGIRNYIWFQGESLESLINFKKKETLKDAVKHISYYPFYEKLSEIISKSKVKISGIESRKLKDLNKQNSAVRDIIWNQEGLKNTIEREEKKKSQIESDIQTISIALTDGETKISGLATYSDLIRRYKECENELSVINLKINQLDEFQREKLPCLWILRGIQPMIIKCKQIIEDHKAEEYTVPERKYIDNPSRAKLEEILRDKRCFVCGTEFSEEGDPFKYIADRLKLQDEYYKEMEDYTNNMQLSKRFNMFVGKIQDFPDSLIRSLALIDNQWQKSEEEVDKLLALRRKKNEDKNKLDQEIEEAKKKYGVDPVKEASAYNIIQSGVKASRSNLERLKKNLDSCNQTISDSKLELRDLDKDLQKQGKSGKAISKVVETEWKNISTYLEDICKKVQEAARKELLIKIENKANEFYTKFTMHDNGYKGDVKISEDYSIEFDPGLNTSHEDRKKMSIINALLALNQEAMNTYYPFISDAPTSSFDLETTHKYLLGIKDIFTQSIIMTKDVDLESDKYMDLFNQDKVSKIYVLESELYCSGKEPDLHEVSTKVRMIKG